jgi:hypothetical protein
MAEKLLTDAQVKKLILSCAAFRQDGASKDEMEKVIEWAERVVLDHGLLQTVLAGDLAVGLGGDGKVRFAELPPVRAGTLRERFRAIDEAGK